MSMEETILVNDDIWLSPNHAGDKGNLVLYLNDPVVYRNTSRVPYPYGPEDADYFLNNYLQRQSELNAPFNWGIRHREAGLIGGIGVFLKEGLSGHKDELGYWLASPFRGQGIMTEVVKKFCQRQFETRPLVRLEAWVFTHNIASLRVLEKAGFEREGTARKFHVKDGSFIDAWLLAQVRE